MVTQRWTARTAVLLAAIGSASALMAAAVKQNTKPTDAGGATLTLPEPAKDASND